MKEFIELIKKLWGNKRYRSVAILLIYLVFFIFVFTFINSNEHNDLKNSIDDKDVIEDKNIIETREYIMEIIGDENFIIDNEIIIYEGVNYSINSNIIDLDKYNISLFNIDNINNLINNGILESVNYVDNSKSYLIDISNLDSSKEGNFRIIVYENKISIDLNDYFNYKVVMELRS